MNKNIKFSEKKRPHSHIFHDLSKSINGLQSKNKIFLFYILVLFIVIQFDFSYSDQYSITIKISGGMGDQQILNENFLPQPNKVFCNNEEINIGVNNTINCLGEGDLTIRMEWGQNQTLNFERMFENLKNLKEVDFSEAEITDASSGSMAYMFSNCISLTSLQGLNSLKRYSVLNMANMFFNCTSLTSIDFSNIDNTANLYLMDNLFKGCTNLQYVDFEGFNAQNVISMNNLFSNCTNLEYINFRNFAKGNQTQYTNMFEGVPDNLVYCRDNNSDIDNIISLLNGNCALMECDNYGKNKKKLVDGETYCTDSCNNNKNCFYKKENKCYSSCPATTHLVTLNNEKLCLNECEENLFFEKNDICVSTCKTLEFFSGECIMNNQDIQAKEDISSKIINDFLYNTITSLNKELIVKYDNESYQITNTEWQRQEYYNGETIINLYDGEGEIKRYYNINMTTPLIIFKEDYFIEEALTPIIEYKVFQFVYLGVEINLTRCCENKRIYLTIPVEINENDIDKYNHSSDYYNCSDKKELNKRKKEYNEKYATLCEKQCIFQKYENKKAICNCPIKTSIKYPSQIYYSNKKDLYFYFEDIEDDIDFLNNETFPGLLDIMKSFFNNQSQNISDLDSLISQILSEGTTELVKKSEDMAFSIMPEEEQNKYDYLSNIDLGDCGTQLKSLCGLSEEDSLLIAKYEIYNDDFLIPKIEYQVYDPLTNQKLSLDICEESKIDIMIPVKINQNEIFKYNSSSDYFSDFCFPYTTDKGTDIIINDRQNEYIDNNMKLCEDNCEFTDYNSETKKAVCNCEIKSEVSFISQLNFDKDKMRKEFSNVKNKMNLKTMKCYKTVFSSKGLEKNIGSYVLLVVIGVNIGIISLFITKGLGIISNKINCVKDIIKNKIDNNKNNINEKDSPKETKKEKNKKKENKDRRKSLNKKSPTVYKNIKKFNKQETMKDLKNNPNKKNNKNKLPLNDNCSDNKSEDKKLKKSKRNKNSKKRNSMAVKSNKLTLNKVENLTNTNLNNNSPNNMNISFNDYNEYELNNLDYKEAKLIDNRTYFQYYFSLLKRKQVLIFTFYTSTDYNARILKISLFLFSFVLYITVTALFFNDSTMYKIYEDEGSFNFIYQIPKILYSTIISVTINFIILFLSLTEKDIIKIKTKAEEKKESLDDIIANTEKCLKLKIIIFFSLDFLFLLFFWYYLSSFSGVYRNTQTHLFKDASISYLLSMLYPFGLSLLPGFLRIPALRKNDKEFLYKISKLVQLV